MSSTPSSAYRNRATGRYRWVPALVVFVLWVSLLVSQILELSAESRRHRQALEDSGVASVRTLEAAIRSMGRGRRHRPEFLGAILEEVTALRGFRGSWLTDLSGVPVVSVGGERSLPDPREFSGASWHSGELLVGRRVEIGECPIDGWGRPRPPAEIDEPLFLFVSLDSSEIEREIGSHLRLRVAVQAVATLAAVGAILLLSSREKARRLRLDLAISEERARRHREWAALGAGLAHETKNPLSVIRGVAQRLAQDTAEDPDRAARASEIVDEVDRVVSRINEFLSFSRPREPEPASVELCPLLEEMARLIQIDLDPTEGTVETECRAVTVLADPDMLRQTLLNLLVNAARAIPRGGRIRLRALQDAAGGVCLEVEDNGPGIPGEERERIFEPYFTKTPGGTGLGLAIVKRLADLHGWTIEVDESPESGATFRIRGMKP